MIVFVSQINDIKRAKIIAIVHTGPKHIISRAGSIRGRGGNHGLSLGTRSGADSDGLDGRLAGASRRENGCARNVGRDDRADRRSYLSDHHGSR